MGYNASITWYNSIMLHGTQNVCLLEQTISQSVVCYCSVSLLPLPWLLWILSDVLLRRRRAFRLRVRWCCLWWRPCDITFLAVSSIMNVIIFVDVLRIGENISTKFDLLTPLSGLFWIMVSFVHVKSWAAQQDLTVRTILAGLVSLHHVLRIRLR